jgi:Ni/Co efflux regulator RcnB
VDARSEPRRTSLRERDLTSQREFATAAALAGSPHWRPVARTVAVVQSNYIPWKGYFDLIRMADELVLYDDVQYTRRDWRNRNLIKTPRGVEWLSIPVNSKGNYLAPIKDITVSDDGWRRRHWNALLANYGRAPCFKAYRERFEESYLGTGERRLSDVNRRFLGVVCDALGIRTRVSWSMDYHFDRFQADRSQRLIDLCHEAGATRYLSGPTARGYCDDDLFAREGIELVYLDYSGYPEYPQAHPPFDHHVSILDLLFNMGPDAPRYMLAGR